MGVIILPSRNSLIKPPVGTQIDWGHPLANGLIGCWLLNEGGGQTATDLVGLSHGAFTNMSGSNWRGGLDGIGTYLSATNQYITCGANPILNQASSAITVITRVVIDVLKPNAGAESVIIGKDNESTRQLNFNLGYDPNDYIAFYVWWTGGGYTQGLSAYPIGSLSVGKLYQFAGRWQSGSGIGVFINGLQSGTDSATKTGTIIQTTEPFCIGGRGATSTYPFRGYISQVLYYNTCLTKDQIAWLYAEPYCFLQPVVRRFYSIPVEDVLVTPSPVSAIAQVVAPTVIKGSISVTPSPASCLGQVVAPTVIIGAVYITPSPISAIASVVAPSVVKGSISITPSTAQAKASVVAPVALVEGSVSITPSPAQAIASVVAPTAVTERTATTSALYGVATYGNAVYGVVGEEGLAVTPIPIQAKASVVAPTVIKGSVSITPAYAQAKGQVAQPTVKLGNIIYAPTFIRAIAKAVGPTVALGAVVPGPASAKAAGANPVLVLSSISITPTAIHAIAQVVPPIVGVETPVYVTPDPASSLAGVVAPTVVCGAVVVIPSPLSAIASVIAPTVRQGDIYLIPGYAKALAKVMAPTVIQASLTIAPESVKAIARGQNPGVILASMTISPAFVRALAGVINPTVFQAWIGKKLQVRVITTTARQVDILTTQKRQGDVVTTQKRNVTVVTGE